MDDFELHMFFEEQGLPCYPDCPWCKEADDYRNRGCEDTEDEPCANIVK